MEKESIVFNSRIPKRYKHQILGEGTCGNCYLTKDGDVYKEMKDSARDLYYPIKDIVGVESELIAFPKSIVYYKRISKEGFRGYLMNHLKGILLCNVSDEINFERFVYFISILENEIQRVSDEGISLFDISDINMLYDEIYGLSLIDPDLYEKDLYTSKSICYENNMIEFFNAIMKYIFISDSVYFDDERIDDLYRYCGYIGKLKPSDFLYEFAEFINKNSATNVKTLSNFRNNGRNYYKIG